MHQLLFKNRFNALVFVAIILFSVRILVGTPNEDGALEKATARFSEEQPGPGSVRDAEQPAPRPIATEFTPEEELVDDTSGEDPAGWSTEPVAEEAPAFDTVEIIDDSSEG